MNLSSADLNGAKLYMADLSDAGLSWANLNGADLSKANFHGAKLLGANLYGANLNQANLSGAALGGAKLFRANLSDAELNNRQTIHQLSHRLRRNNRERPRRVMQVESSKEKLLASRMVTP